MIRSSFGDGRYFATENDLIVGVATSWSGAEPRHVLYLHGSGTNAAGVLASPNQITMINGLGRHATVHAGDYAGEAWGNDTGVARLRAAVTYLKAAWGAQGKVALVAVSMGMTNALNYARVYPDEVACVAGVIPCVDIKSIYDLGAQAVIDGAYPPTYDDATVGQTHSPIHMAQNGLIPADLPVHLWTVPNDATTLPATADAFVAARPQTGRTIMAPLGHTTAAVAAAVPDVLAFVDAHT